MRKSIKIHCGKKILKFPDATVYVFFDNPAKRRVRRRGWSILDHNRSI